MKILIDRDGTFMEPAQTRARKIGIDGDVLTVTNGLRAGRQIIDAELPPRTRMWWRDGQWVDKPPISPIAPEDVAKALEEDKIRSIMQNVSASKT